MKNNQENLKDEEGDHNKVEQRWREKQWWQTIITTIQ